MKKNWIRYVERQMSSHEMPQRKKIEQKVFLDRKRCYLTFASMFQKWKCSNRVGDGRKCPAVSNALKVD